MLPGRRRQQPDVVDHRGLEAVERDGHRVGARVEHRNRERAGRVADGLERAGGGVVLDRDGGAGHDAAGGIDDHPERDEVAPPCAKANGCATSAHAHVASNLIRLRCMTCSSLRAALSPPASLFTSCADSESTSATLESSGNGSNTNGLKSVTNGRDPATVRGTTLLRRQAGWRVRHDSRSGRHYFLRAVVQRQCPPLGSGGLNRRGHHECLDGCRRRRWAIDRSRGRQAAPVCRCVLRAEAAGHRTIL